jgi:hypothetical protein
VVLAADGLLLSATLSEMHTREGRWAAVWVAGMVMLVWDLYALSWVGPWMGLNSRNPSRASMAALTRICLLPWLLWLGGVAVLSTLDAFLRFRLPFRWQAWMLLLGWFVLGAALNLAFAGWAAHRLKTAFRDIATRRIEAAPRYGEWGRILGGWLRKAIGW